MSSSQHVVVFFPEGAFGPTNNCVGIADVLRRRGMRVVFVVEESFAGTLEAKGFEERHMRLKPAPELAEEPGQFWKDFIRDTAPHFRDSTVVQLETLMKPIWEELVSGSRYVEPRLREIFSELRPDAIVQDNVVAFPAVVASEAPWVRLLSCNPLELRGPDLPPTYSGLPVADSSLWEAFNAEYRRLHEDLHADFSEFCQAHGCPPLPGNWEGWRSGEFMYTSPHLNLTLFPAEADYARAQPLPPTFHRLDTSVRDTDAAFEMPDLPGGGKLIYASLGSLGSADSHLLNRLVGLLADTPHRVILSLGAQAGQIKLPPNVYGEAFLPQPSILPLVDMVVTHGGNNTITESFHFGKPMLALPLFWDQHDNAQRVDEIGFGLRLDTYGFTDAQFHAALEELLGNRHRQQRLRAVSARVRSAPGTVRAADLIQSLAQTGGASA